MLGVDSKVVKEGIDDAILDLRCATAVVKEAWGGVGDLRREMAVCGVAVRAVISGQVLVNAPRFGIGNMPIWHE